MDLICFTTGDYRPAIRAASAARPWMDATPERFAYRCLPLAMANAHGWEVLSPSRFAARWDGGSSLSAITVQGRGTDGLLPSSHFGCGILTFHLGCVLRTSHGHDLFVSGPPNRPKDAIQPLSAIVETDWSPFPFTMNWQFTRSNHWIEFDEGEPFCFFFPTQRSLLESVEPRTRPIASDPELNTEFQAWAGSRRDFLAKLREPESDARGKRWQRHYFEGRLPSGAPGCPTGHRTRVRPHPFTDD